MVDFDKLFAFQEVKIFDENELKYSETKRWLKSQVDNARESWTDSRRPSTVDLFNIVDEIIDDEILACEKANGSIEESENGFLTDIDFFQKCKKELKFIRVRTLLYARFDDAYVKDWTHSYTRGEHIFVIDKHYDNIWASLMEELYNIVGFNFSVVNRYGGLAIIVKF